MTDDTLTRRAWLARVATTVLAGAAMTTVLPRAGGAAPKPTSITVYKDPSCGCCKKWVEHLRANGFVPEVHDRSDMDALKDSLGVPAALRSCHTGVVGKYVIEGHVPAADVKQLLATMPAKTVGIAAPGMPAGSPGMEAAGKEPYATVLVRADGTTGIFARH